MGKIRQNQQITNRTDFFYYAFRNIILISIPIAIISGLILSHLSFHVSAEAPNNGSGTSTDSLTFSISSSCTLSSAVDSSHNAELNNGTYVDGIGKTTITTLCNDGNGYSIYAVGYSGNVEGNNQLVNTVNSNFNIDTGLATSGLTSNWAMSLNNVVNDISPTPPEIEDDYDGVYGLVPTEWTKVASLPSRSTDMVKGSSFTTTYAVYTSSFQNAGTYNGQVKYMLLHPSTMTVYPIMQDIALWKDIRLPNVGDSIQAIDSRDGKKYWVTKLADDNIWMTQNLDLDIVADEQDPTKIKTLTSEDTDLTDHSLTGAYSGANGYSYDESTGIITWTPASAAKTIDFEGTTVTGWQSSNTEPYSASKTDDINTGHASLGNYYNWTITIASNDSSTLTDDTLNNISQNPQNSICPKGWRLPTISNQSETTIGSTNEFARLNYLYNSITTTPIYFMLSGGINTGLSNAQDEYGFYWSSTVFNADYSYHMFLSTNSFTPSRAYHKNRGFSVRCLAR